ncbi:Acyl-CoA-binding domain-containing protein 5 [Podila verticillata]|nr:Acyl-CoA-binding domain-containing protein 5 [Podila verticillata]
MMLHTTPKFSFATLAFLVLYYTTVPLAHAQYAPNTVWGASSVFIENQAMYISGGYNLDYQSWTFLIDFTQGWDISAPASRQLRTSPSADASVPNALLNDQNTWLVVSKYKSYRYEIKQDSWSPIANLANLYPVNNWTQSGAADPTTGLFYIPNGFQLPGGDYTMLQYDFAQNKTTPITAPGAPDSDLLNYSTVWSPYLRKLVVFGGLSARMHSESDRLYTFDPVQKTWAEPITTGPRPPARSDSCGVSMHGGTKLVYFGGLNGAQGITALNDIYILDTTTMVWTQGAPAGSSSYGRAFMSCGASGDQFISWGGCVVTEAVVSYNVTMIYNIQSGAWVSRFDPASKYVPSESATGTGTGPPGPSATQDNNSVGSKAGLIGGVGGGVVVFALIAGLIFHRRKSKRTAQDKGLDDGNKSGEDSPRLSIVPMSHIHADHIWKPPTLAAAASVAVNAQNQHQDRHAPSSPDQHYYKEPNEGLHSAASPHSWSSPEHKSIVTTPLSTYASTRGSPQHGYSNSNTSPTSTFASRGDQPKKSLAAPRRPSARHLRLPRTVTSFSQRKCSQPKLSLGSWIELKLLGASEKGLQTRHS